MPFKIVRNDITKMNTEAVVNTANDLPTVGSGCDSAIYAAAGIDELLDYRQRYVGVVEEGEAFITPGFKLKVRYIIHAVSPFYIDGEHGEEEKLRDCYRNSLELAVQNNVKSIAFPLIATGSFGYPKEAGMRIAVDEINAFLLTHDMEIYLVVFDDKAATLGEKLYPQLETFIDRNYVRAAHEREYGDYYRFEAYEKPMMYYAMSCGEKESVAEECSAEPDEEAVFEELSEKLNERLQHRSDTFSEYLLYLIELKGMKNSEVYSRAIVDKRYFSKIKNNKDFHPEKLKALCLCVGAKLSLDETRDLLARAGYALSPSDLTDIIFSFFIENKHYDVIDIDIQLEEHGLPCIIS